MGGSVTELQQPQTLLGPPIPSGLPVSKSFNDLYKATSTPSLPFPPPPISEVYPPPSPSQAQLPGDAVKTLAVTPTRDGEGKEDEKGEMDVEELPVEEPVVEEPVEEKENEKDVSNSANTGKFILGEV